MTTVAIELLYSTMVEVVPRTVAVLIPLLGAFWIFKVREQGVSEGKIFEVGRDIANILQFKQIRDPVDMFYSHWIDMAKYKINEANHERALQALLKKNLFNYSGSRDPTDEERLESAQILVALAAEHWHRLVPPTITWSGRGSAYSPFGVKVQTRDTYFPFGTKLYREWIDRFSGSSQQLWAITSSRRYFVDAFPGIEDSAKYGPTRESVDKWFDDIHARLSEIHPLHAKLLTQLQTIDTQIDLFRLGRNIAHLLLYLALLAVVGYFVPKLLYSMGFLTTENLALLVLSSLLSYGLIALRIVSAVLPVRESDMQRRIFLPALVAELEGMTRRLVRFRPHVIRNVVSISADLKLPSRLTGDLRKLSDALDEFNECASSFYGMAQEKIREIEENFKTSLVNQSGIPISVADFVSDDFNFTEMRKRILHEDANLTFSAEETQMSRTIVTLNLSELNRERRLALCDHLEWLSAQVRSSSAYSSTELAFDRLQKLRARCLGMTRALVSVYPADGVTT